MTVRTIEIDPPSGSIPNHPRNGGAIEYTRSDGRTGRYYIGSMPAHVQGTWFYHRWAAKLALARNWRDACEMKVSEIAPNLWTETATH